MRPRLTDARFMQLVEQALDSLPAQFRERMQNVAVLVRDYPPGERPSRLRRGPRPRRRTMGVYVGVPRTEKSVFDTPTGPDYVILYKKNIEAVCRSEREIRDEIRLTVIHEVGHYFGLDEEQLRHV